MSVKFKEIFTLSGNVFSDYDKLYRKHCFLIPLAEDYAYAVPKKYKDSDINEYPLVKDEVKKYYHILRSEDADAQYVHFGVGGLLNLDIAGEAKVDAIVLCDINANQLELWEHILELIANTERRVDFLNTIRSRTSISNSELNLSTNFDAGDRFIQLYFFHQNFFDEYISHSPFLQSDEVYAHVRELVLSNKVATAPVDFLDKKQCEEARKVIEDNGYIVASVFSSNINAHFRTVVGQDKNTEYKTKASGHFKDQPHGRIAEIRWEEAMRSLAGQNGKVYALSGLGMLSALSNTTTSFGTDLT